MNSNSMILDVQGFKNVHNKFIIKELAFAYSNYTQSFLIKPPYLFRYLTNEEKMQIKWLERNRGIYWNEGYIDYREFQRIIVPYLENQNILVKGSEKVKWVNDLCGNCNITDLGEENCPSLLFLSQQYCDESNNLNCINHKKHCALKNVLCLKKYLNL